MPEQNHESSCGDQDRTPEHLHHEDGGPESLKPERVQKEQEDDPGGGDDQLKPERVQ